MEISQRVELECTACDGGDELMKGMRHDAECPALAWELYKTNTVRFPCPDCKQFEVEINADGHYECRDCHTQYAVVEGNWLPGARNDVLILECIKFIELGHQLARQILDQREWALPNRRGSSPPEKVNQGSATPQKNGGGNHESCVYFPAGCHNRIQLFLFT